MIEFIAGGARSGKSAHALARARELGGNLVFVATAQAWDPEMEARIQRHQAERGEGWNLRECSLELGDMVREFSAGDTVLVDCLTLWLTNWLCGDNPGGWEDEKNGFMENIRNSDANWLLVSNETGMGIVPEGKLSRDFQDLSGWLHQEVAAVADSVTLVLFGLPQKLK